MGEFRYFRTCLLSLLSESQDAEMHVNSALTVLLHEATTHSLQTDQRLSLNRYSPKLCTSDKQGTLSSVLQCGSYNKGIQKSFHPARDCEIIMCIHCIVNYFADWTKGVDSLGVDL